MSRLLRLLAIVAASAAWGLAADGAGRPSLVVEHVNVVDVASGVIHADTTVVMGAGRIVDVRNSLRHEAFPGATVVDGSGKYLVPGLWDMHVHFDADAIRDLDLFVANGVLGIRNMGGVAEEVFGWRRRVADGEVLGPRIVACGPILDGPEPTNPPISVPVRDAAEGRRAVRWLRAAGADCVKVHDGVPLDAYLAIAEEAKRVALPLVGHIPVRVRTLQAAEAGQRTVEHQIGLRGASTVEDAVMESEARNDVFAEAMRTKNFGLIPEEIARKGNLLLDHFSAERAEGLYRAFARSGTCLDPTLVTDRALTFVDDLNAREDPRSQYVPPAVREWWKPEKGMLTRYRTPAYIAFRKRQFRKTLDQIPLARRAGVRFLAGTDTTIPFVYPGFSLHDELQLLVEAGLTPLQALQTATINPATCMGLGDSGTVAPGKRASVVLLDADPLHDIANTRAIEAVVLEGRLLRRSQLDELLRSAGDLARQ